MIETEPTVEATGGERARPPARRRALTRLSRRAARSGASILIVVALGATLVAQIPRRSSAGSVPTSTALAQGAGVPTIEEVLVEALVSAELSLRTGAATRLIESMQGTISFSLVDLATGAQVDAPEEQVPLRAASVIKVGIAVAFLRQEPDPSEADRSLLEAMIERSDNDAATALYDRIGGEAGLQAVLDTLGLEDTTPSPSWGFTTTTAGDMARLFAAVASGEVLSESGTALLASMMAQVGVDQRWGIADAVADGIAVAVKNGWYPDDDAPVWRVNCGAMVGDPTSGVVLAVTTQYPQALGMAYGQEVCRQVAAAVLPSSLQPS